MRAVFLVCVSEITPLGRVVTTCSFLSWCWEDEPKCSAKPVICISGMFSYLYLCNVRRPFANGLIMCIYLTQRLYLFRIYTYLAGVSHEDLILRRPPRTCSTPRPRRRRSTPTRPRTIAEAKRTILAVRTIETVPREIKRQDRLCI